MPNLINCLYIVFKSLSYEFYEINFIYLPILGIITLDSIFWPIDSKISSTLFSSNGSSLSNNCSKNPEMRPPMPFIQPCKELRIIILIF